MSFLLARRKRKKAREDARGPSRECLNPALTLRRRSQDPRPSQRAAIETEKEATRELTPQKKLPRAAEGKGLPREVLGERRRAEEKHPEKEAGEGLPTHEYSQIINKILQ